MQLHQARRADLSNKKKIRVGRGPGSGLGKTAGRGIKGATSRSGYAMKVTYEGGQMPLFRRLPKRGFRNGRFMVTFFIVNVDSLAVFPAGSTVGLAELRAKGLVRGAKNVPVKILGSGELNVALNVSADAFTKGALEKIQKAGGTVEWIGGAPKKKAPNFKQIDAAKKLAEKAKPKVVEGKGAPEDKGVPAAEGKPAKAAKVEKPAKTADEKAPEAKTHDAKTHEVKAHEVKAHEVKAHEVKAHEVKAHEAKDHEGKIHEVKAHEVKAHEVKAHEVKAHEAKNPEAKAAPKADDTEKKK